MTEQEMIELFGERYNLSSNSNDDKLDDEVYLYLNAAQDRFINQRFTGNPSGLPFQLTQKRIDDLRTLITESGDLSAATNPSPTIPNGKRYTTPANLRFFIKAYPSINGNPVSAEMITLEESYKWIQTPNNNPIVREAKVLYENATTFTVIVDPTDLANLGTVKVQYIKIPTTIASGTNSELPNHTHREIVEIAVGLAIEGIENIDRYQTHSDKLKTVE